MATLMCFVLPCVGQEKHSETNIMRLPWESWQLHVGDEPGCTSAGDAECNLEPYSNDLNRYGVEWQRIEVTLPVELRQQPLGLLVQGEEPVYEVFANGQRIGGSGSFTTHLGPQDSRIIIPIPPGLTVGGHLVLAIRELNMHTYLPISYFVPTIAPTQEMQRVMDDDTLTYLRASWQHYLGFAALGGIGLFFFLLFSINTKLREYFWLGALLTLLFIFRVGELASVFDLGMPSWMGISIYVVGNCVQAAIIVEFIFAFLGSPVSRVFRLLQFGSAPLMINSLLLIPFLFPLVSRFLRYAEPVIFNAFGASVFFAVLAQLLLLPMCFRSKLPEMRWIGGAILFLTLVEDRWHIGWVLSLGFPKYLHWGSLDFDIRPVAWLLFAIVMLIAMTFRLRRIQDRNRDVEQEIAAARGVQQLLIAEALPLIPGLTVESAYLPAQEVGGDFFQVLPLESSGAPDAPTAFVVLGDVSGKGMKAAMTVSLIVGALRASARKCTGPAELLKEVNQSLFGRADGFATCLIMMMRPSGSVSLANAGHPNPYLDGVEIATDCNLPLGLTLDVTYSESTLQLEPGLRLALVTDGVVEATHAASRELFGFERTQAVSRSSAAEIAESARSFGLGVPQADDITVLTVARGLIQPTLVLA